MRAAHLFLAAFCAVTPVAPACAQTGPVIVVPGKAGVPVIMNGMIVDGAVVYGDWGLARPGQSELVIEGPVAFVDPLDSRNFYPATGRAPRLGRQEIEPKHRRPQSTSFHREWSAESNFSAPVTVYPPFEPPPVIMAPRERRSSRSNGSRGTAPAANPLHSQ
jgi:hypothetical protein